MIVFKTSGQIGLFVLCSTVYIRML